MLDAAGRMMIQCVVVSNPFAGLVPLGNWKRHADEIPEDR